jgi:DNA-3-methyladenine glycosylase II
MHDRDKALVHFRKVDPAFHKAALPVRKLLPEKLVQVRTGAGLFERLASSVISQQLATGAASAIRKRVIETCGGKLTPKSILSTPLPKLRAAGLSGAKVKTLQSLARAIEEGSLDLLALKRMPESDAVAEMVKVWGIGPWTAEMFLIFALGRPNVFSAGDLGLVRSMERIYKLKKDTPREKLLKIAKRWAPYQSFACLVLWESHDTRKKK